MCGDMTEALTEGDFRSVNFDPSCISVSHGTNNNIKMQVCIVSFKTSLTVSSSETRGGGEIVHYITLENYL